MIYYHEHFLIYHHYHYHIVLLSFIIIIFNFLIFVIFFFLSALQEKNLEAEELDFENKKLHEELASKESSLQHLEEGNSKLFQEIEDQINGMWYMILLPILITNDTTNITIIAITVTSVSANICPLFLSVLPDFSHFSSPFSATYNTTDTT